MAITGGCLCGAVRFEVDEQPAIALNCHCSICRRAHGAAFGTFTVARLANFAWKQGEDMLGVYASSPGFRRSFCRHCGAHLTVLEDWNPEGITLVLAALDDGHGLRPQAHMFTDSKAAWYDIRDGLPQHPAWPPGVGPSAA